MPYVTTLIAPQQAPFFDDGPTRALAATGLRIEDRRVLETDRAIDLYSPAAPTGAAMDGIRARFGIDVLTQDADTRAKRLFVADMDATMVEEETLDELAAHAGIKDKIAAITARAMNGDIDFKAALYERVGLLAGLPVAALAETAEKMHFTPGGARLLKTLKAHGVACVLVSGGFTFFTGHVASALGFDRHYGNTLGVDANALTGTVEGPVIDKAFKEKILRDTAAQMSIPLQETTAIGDGANDLPMLKAAGLGVGWRPKALLREKLDNHILFGGLETLAYGLGLAPHSV